MQAPGDACEDDFPLAVSAFWFLDNTMSRLFAKLAYI